SGSLLRGNQHTALAYEAAPSIEAARIPASERVACSYRFKVKEGTFFSDGSGWPDYEAKTEELLHQFSHVLVTDITDFYNQIYLHRLNNAIESSNAGLKPFAAEIENFLLTLNSKSSQGLPVGPAASIVMAEAVLIDVDLFLRAQGVAHTRYVDDIRLFSDSPRHLQKVLEKLTLYLYENHRLTVSSEKTELLDSPSFSTKHLHNHYADAKSNLLEELEEFNPYSDEYDEFEIDEAGSEPDEGLIQAIEKVINYDHLDLGLARSVIRTARRNSVDVIAEHLLQHFDFFAPVVNDVVLYLHEVTFGPMPQKLLPHLEAVAQSAALDSQLVRYWIEAYVAQYPEYMASPILYALVYSGPNIDNQALAAISTKNVAWVRSHKASIYNLGGWGRRAVLNASRVLPSDERTHWLKLFSGNSPVLLDRLVAKWVQETA
ncbi:conserved hypothetical protein, partial [Acidovorax delafieldii 2AN]